MKQTTNMTAESETATRIAVVGAGITGLAAALRIHEAAPECGLVVLDADPRAGGVLQTVTQDDFLIERSADAFITNVPWATDLCTRVGMTDEMLSTNAQFRRAFVVNRGRVQDIPEGFVIMAPRKIRPLITTPILSLRGKLRLAAEYFVPRRDDDVDESLESFAKRRFGNEVFERLIQPLVGGIYTADPSRLSLRSTLPQFVEMERDHGSLIKAALRTARQQKAAAKDSAARYGLFTTPRGGMSQLVEAVISRLPENCLHLSAAVSQLIREPDDGWIIECADQQRMHVDGVVLATPADAAATILRSVDQELAGELNQIPHAGSAVVSLGYRVCDISHPLDGFGFVVPLVERREILSASFSSVKFEHRAPDQCVLVRVFIGGACQPELVDLPRDQLTELAMRELRELLGISGDPLTVDVARWPSAMPQYHVGHMQLIQKVRRLTTTHPGLELAGKSYDGVGIPSCIRSGEQAAEKLLNWAGLGS